MLIANPQRLRSLGIGPLKQHSISRQRSGKGIVSASPETFATHGAMT